MGLEGALRIELALSEGTVDRVTVASTRPVHASRVLHGMTPEAALDRLPRLFAVCGAAQACAAAAALEQARGLPTRDGDAARRRMLVLAETAQEHLWRLFIDGPRLWSAPPLLPGASAARTLLPRLRKTLFPQGGWCADDAPLDAAAVAAAIEDLEQLLARDLFGMSAAAWRERAAQPRWWAEDASLADRLLQHIERRGWLALGDSAPSFLPPMEPDWLERRFAHNDGVPFIAAPTVDGIPCETTPLARHWSEPSIAALAARHGTGLATRLTALLLELAHIPMQLRRLVTQETDPAPSPFSTGKGIGLAQVEAARGRLIHRAELHDDATIRRYQILAPTEWNFHPQGLLVRALAGLPGRDATTARQQAELLVQAIDPCVGFTITVQQAECDQTASLEGE